MANRSSKTSRPDKGSVLVVGYNSRVAACSARRAGYKVYSLGHYEDLDLLQCVENSIRFEDQPESILPFLKKFDVDKVVLGAGFEDADVPASMVLGNDPKIARDVGDKVWLAKKLDELGIPQPEIYDRDNVRYPCIAKPIVGGGGHKNYKVLDESMLPPEDEYFLQELVTGMPLSVCTLSTGSEAMPVSVNEILVGKKWLGVQHSYTYCGNVTPYLTRFKDQMCDIARKLIPALGLVGTNGIDFIVNKDGPKVLEINARFQGSLDAVEMATGENMFQAHVDAINGKLRPFKIKQFGYRAILFTSWKTKVVRDLSSPQTADIPPVGTVYDKDCALVSINCTGKTRGEASACVRDTVRRVRKGIQRV
ncbi:ATP-grasp domain-containing protein [Methanocella sp. MCL-LM]|uniref:ATP-grasp domain-containing protein n=1 Tax=Methanocella sp. MCL-LM TaxID=3412035 RepID=UPI003C755D91